MSTPTALSFPCLLQQFFVQRLIQQQHASPAQSRPTATASGCCWTSRTAGFESGQPN